MSERPFMQLYVSDFIGDTLHLSTEQVGAYLLLLMAMWNAGGSLPDDEAKLARIVRMSVKKWRAVAADLLPFFEQVGGAVRHNRLTKELQKSEGKSQSRASAGAEGGRAKALKDKQAALANATPLPQHLPDTITRDQNAASQHSAGKGMYDRLIAAASSRGGCHPSLAMGIQPVKDFLAKNYDLDRDFLPIVLERASPIISSWNYFIKIAVARAAEKAAIPPKPEVPAEDWSKRIAVWQQSRTWAQAWGPKPGETGCKVPPELLRTAA
jgi:uncharacterized protein YdaU (DUF1376 family)